MAAILREILARKREEVARAKAAAPAAELAALAEAVQEPARGFRAALVSSPRPRVIAEIKRRSPSRGVIRADFDLLSCARAYAEGGAAAISVLTDEHFFGGHLDFLGEVRRAVSLPLLRKDFVVDRYQVDQTRVYGGDAVLLMASVLDPADLRALRLPARPGRS